MLPTELPQYFKTIGARLDVHGEIQPRFGKAVSIGDGLDRAMWRNRQPFKLDIRQDGGEHYRLDVTVDAPDFRVLQVRKDERHLLLYAAGSRPGTNKNAERLLCGHDERHWFVAAIGEPVSTVMAARRALLPKELRRTGLNKTTLASRRNDTFQRQGEWFFVPVRDARLLEQLALLPIHGHEPIQRGRQNKPHRCDELVRFGGTRVYINKSREYSPEEWAAIPAHERGRLGRVEERVKDMIVYVRGGIRHPDHATITLEGWHQVLLNGEIVSSNVTFYD